jgi:hypothetical protein
MNMISGYKAIEYAEAHGLTLNKYADPTEDAREGLTPAEARRVASEDPSLVYVARPVRQKAARDWFAVDGNVQISDGETICTARFSPRASDERIVREYLSTYGYADPQEMVGRWNEGWLERDGQRVDFWWSLTSAEPRRVDGALRYPFVLRFSQPAPGEVRADGYRY